MGLVILCWWALCTTSWRGGGSLTGPKSGRNICVLILTLKHWSREPAKKQNHLGNAYLRHLEKSKCSSVGGTCRTYQQEIIFPILLVKQVLHHGKILNTSICLFQSFGKIKISGSWLALDLQKPQRDVHFLRCPLFFASSSSFLETMLLPKSLISIIFWNLIDFNFKKMMEKT